MARLKSFPLKPLQIKYVNKFCIHRSMDFPDPLLAEVLAAPPMNTLLASSVSDEQARTLARERWRAKDALVEMREDLCVLGEELKLLSQVLYKIHNRFRNDKGYKDLRMLEKSVRRLQGLDFPRVVEGFLSFLLTDTAAHAALPSAAMGRHAALQLYGAAALSARVLTLATGGALLAVQRLNLGHFWGVAAHQLGMVGRLWVGRSLLATLHRTFPALLAIIRLLPGPAADLPATLDTFLPEDMVEALARQEGVVEDQVQERSVSLDTFLDIGVPVRRAKEGKLEAQSTKERSPTNSSDNKSEKVKDALSDIHSLEELRTFLETESKSRKVSRKTCFTASLKQDVWKETKSDVLKAFNEKTPNKSMKQCRAMLRGAVSSPP